MPDSVLTQGKDKQKHFQQVEKTEFLRGGENFFNLLIQVLNDAKFEIHFQVYILENDQTGLSIVEALIRAANRGVKVHLVLDAFGTDKLPSDVIARIKSAGIEFKWFRPAMQIGNMEIGRRMHHKFVSIDERICLVMGMNMADRYNDVDDIPAWLDFGVLIEGVTAKEIKKRALQIWEKNYELTKRLAKFRLPKVANSVSSGKTMVKVSVNDWLRGRIDIFTGYNRSFQKAKDEILIVGGYFLPGRILRRRLHEATQRGVKVKVMLTGKSDVMFAKEATEYLYQWMFKHNIEVFEWKGGNLHGKVAVVDKVWCTVGSFNLNYLSTFESIELNLEIIDSLFANQVSDFLNKIIDRECHQITEETYSQKLSVSKRMMNFVSFVIVRWSMRFLNTFANRPEAN